MSLPADYAVLHRSFVRSLRAENHSPRTIEAYSLVVDQLGEHLKRLRTDPLTTTAGIRRAHVEGFLVRLAERGLAAATLTERYRSLNRFFGFLAEEEEIPAHPMAKMRRPHVPDQPVPVLRDEQLQALLHVMRGREFTAVRDTAIVRLLVDTGIRRAELLGLEVSAVDLDQEVVIVLGKGRVGRGRAGSGPAPSVGTWRQTPASVPEVLWAFPGDRGRDSVAGLMRSDEQRVGDEVSRIDWRLCCLSASQETGQRNHDPSRRNDADGPRSTAEHPHCPLRSLFAIVAGRYAQDQARPTPRDYFLTVGSGVSYA